MVHGALHPGLPENRSPRDSRCQQPVTVQRSRALATARLPREVAAPRARSAPARHTFVLPRMRPCHGIPDQLLIGQGTFLHGLPDWPRPGTPGEKQQQGIGSHHTSRGVRQQWFVRGFLLATRKRRQTEEGHQGSRRRIRGAVACTQGGLPLSVIGPHFVRDIMTPYKPQEQGREQKSRTALPRCSRSSTP